MSEQSTFVEHSFFTDHVRSNYEWHLDDVYQKLESLLLGHLKRHFLTPACLGYGGKTWEDRGTGTALVDDEQRGGSTPNTAMTELLDDCYVRVFIARDNKTKTSSQKDYMEMAIHGGDSLEGLVAIIVKQWVEELHARKDPRGSAIFNNLREAVREMVDDPDSQLIVIKGPRSKFDRETILGVAESAEDPIDYQTVASYVGADPAWQTVLKRVTKYQISARRSIKKAVESMANDGNVPIYFTDLLSATKEKCYDQSPHPTLTTEEVYDDESKMPTTYFRTTNENEGYKTKDDEVTQKLCSVHDTIDQSNRSNSVKERQHKFVDLLALHCFEKQTDPTEQILATIARELGVGRTTIYDDLKRLGLGGSYDSAEGHTEE